jgi:hypothetical protein
VGRKSPLPRAGYAFEGRRTKPGRRRSKQHQIIGVGFLPVSSSPRRMFRQRAPVSGVAILLFDGSAQKGQEPIEQHSNRVAPEKRTCQDHEYSLTPQRGWPTPYTGIKH